MHMRAIAAGAVQRNFAQPEPITQHEKRMTQLVNQDERREAEPEGGFDTKAAPDEGARQQGPVRAEGSAAEPAEREPTAAHADLVSCGACSAFTRQAYHGLV